MGYGDMEATEDLATDSAEIACPALKANPALGRADTMVDAYRQKPVQRPAT